MHRSTVTRRVALQSGAAAALGLALGGSRPVSAQSTLPLITKPIPSTGERLPVIGLGTNAYSVNTAEQMAPLREVLEQMGQLGGTLIDTARVYGRSEAVIGEILQGLGTASSCSSPPRRRWRRLLQPAGGARRVVQRAARPTHRPDADPHDGRPRRADAGVREGEGGEADPLHRHQHLVRQSVHAMMAAMQTYPLDFMQVDYSIGNRNAAESVLALAQERKIGVLINVPFGGRGQGAAAMFAG